MFYTYIIQSESGTFYIGYTSDIVDRLKRHNEGREKFTKRFKKWELVFKEEYQTKSEALKRERYLKSLKSKLYLKNIINDWRGGSSTG